MTTAAQIINRSLRLIGVLASGESPSASEQADALQTLNSMLDAWRNESLMVYALRDETLALTGAASYTIGSGGDLNTTRPVKIEGAYQRVNGVDYPVRLAAKRKYDGIASKSTQTQIADWMYYEPSYPLGKLFLYPLPTEGVLHIATWTPLTSFTAVQSVTLPPGYEEAITYQLAPRLAPEYGKQTPVEVAAIGKAAKDDIKRVNLRIPIMRTGFDTGRRFDIYSDT